MVIVLWGDPRTKKNSMQVIRAGQRPVLLPSPAYRAYRVDCLKQILTGFSHYGTVDYPVNVKCVYYMQTKRKVDLVNLIEGTLDILVDAKVLKDDNSKIAASHDGSRVDYDKENPRVEIEIESIGESNEQSTEKKSPEG